MWKIEAMYKADKIEDKADSYSTPTSALKKGEAKLFHIYSYTVFFYLSNN